MQQAKFKTWKAALVLLGIVMLTACSAVSGSESSSSAAAPSSSQKAGTGDGGKKAAETAASIDWDSLPTKEINLPDKGLTITEAGTYILTGSTSGGVKVKADGDVRIVLAGAAIASSDGAAFYVDKADNAVIELREGRENTIKDSNSHSDSDIEGALHAKTDLTLTGSGKLTVEGNYQDGIVSSDNLNINSGNITVKAQDDGIRGKDSLTVSGGSLDVRADGDGLKASNADDMSKGYVHIGGGAIRVSAADDGIKAASSLTVDEGQVTVTKSSEALEATNVTINGGSLDLYASDDTINAASKVSGAEVFIKITGGDIKAEVGQGDTDALDANGDIIMSGGNLTVTAQFAFDFDGRADYTGGTITVNGEKRTSIIAEGPGHGGR